MTSQHFKSNSQLNVGQASNLIIEKAKLAVCKVIEVRGHIEPPFLPEEYAQLFGIKSITKEDLGDTSGVLLRFQDGYIIKVNQKHNLARQNFSCAHEIGHILFSGLRLERYVQTIEYRTFNPERENKLRYKAREHLCDMVAGELLMPESIFQKYLLEYGLSIDTLEKMSQIFKVSVTAAAIRIAEVSQHPCIAILWKGDLKNKSNTLSINWSIGPKKTAIKSIRYLPVKKQVDQTSSQYKAFTGDDTVISYQSFKSGNLVKSFRVESKRFGYNQNKCVISLAFPIT
jgi:Zn-dependent peptidase ImmA (M78 family)